MYFIWIHFYFCHNFLQNSNLKNWATEEAVTISAGELSGSTYLLRLKCVHFLIKALAFSFSYPSVLFSSELLILKLYFLSNHFFLLFLDSNLWIFYIDIYIVSRQESDNQKSQIKLTFAMISIFTFLVLLSLSLFLSLFLFAHFLCLILYIFGWRPCGVVANMLDYDVLNKRVRTLELFRLFLY